MRALIVGDVWPQAIRTDELARRLGICDDSRPDLFVWTCDASASGVPLRCQRTILTFEPEVLRHMRIGANNLVVAASNHLNDTGPRAVAGLLESFKQHGFHYVGAGVNKTETTMPPVLSTPAGPITFLAFAETEPWVGAVPAELSAPGVWPYDEDKCVDAISSAAQNSEYVWVYLHWGREFIRYPEPRQRRAARRFAEAGATLVVASHTHVPLGWERIGKAYVFYGLGHFLFPNMRTEYGHTYRWDSVSRSGLALEGRSRDRHWAWTAKNIKLSAYGLPRIVGIAGRNVCPDYGEACYADLTAYEDMYPG